MGSRGIGGGVDITADLQGGLSGSLVLTLEGSSEKKMG